MTSNIILYTNLYANIPYQSKVSRPNKFMTPDEEEESITSTGQHRIGVGSN